jgi:hypothetical protein
LWLLCVGLYCLTAPGRITYPDDEIVFQTTESLATRGSLSIDGISKRSGEPKGRPTGTFGWAPGARAEPGSQPPRYGFFGHALSVVAIPMYGLGALTTQWIPPQWSRATRSDLVVFHTRSHEADWPRLVVSFTNCLVTATAAIVFGLWLMALGFQRRTALVSALVYALCTSAWPYTSTFLSEPLSALMLLTAAWGIARWQRGGAANWLWFAAAAGALSTHAHLLNVTALPALLAYAWVADRARTHRGDRRQSWLGALSLGAAALAGLGLDHALRFGNPFESGRYGHYGEFIWPWEGLPAMVVAPGRSLFIYSPAVLIGLAGARAFRQRAPAAAIFVVTVVVLRWVFVATRSDWYGGWGIGPRYLVPIIPFALAPIAIVLERHWTAAAWRRRTLRCLLAGCAVLMAHLAAHSIFEWMFELARRHGTDQYFRISHWSPAATPFVGFASLDWHALQLTGEARGGGILPNLRLDMLSFGALRLAKAGYPGLLVLCAAIAMISLAAATGLWLWLRRDAKRER